jgi:protein TonB
MKRLGLFFLLSVMTVFGAIVSMEQAISPKAREKEAEMQRCVTLTLHAPAKPEPKAENKAQPKPKPKPQEKKPQPRPQPKPKPEPKTESKPAPEKASEAAPQPEEPKADSETEPLPQPQEAVQQPAPEAARAAESAPPQQNRAFGKALEEYYSRLYRRISENRRYPAQARRFGIEGEVGVAFEIDDSGRIVDSRLLRPSGNPLLDREATRIFERIGRFEAPPLGLPQRRFEVTIAYSLRQ